MLIYGIPVGIQGVSERSELTPCKYICPHWGGGDYSHFANIYTFGLIFARQTARLHEISLPIQ